MLRNLKVVVWLLVGYVLAPGIGAACDYTVRDIGFVEFGSLKYSMMVVGPEAAQYTQAESSVLNDWNVSLVTVSSENQAALPTAIQEALERNERPWSIWLVDGSRRCLRLASATSFDDLPTLEAVVEKYLNTPRAQELAREAVGSFAQVVLFEVETDPHATVAQATAATLSKLEPMLPRPISQPARVMIIPRIERMQERVLAWALGGDEMGLAEPVMAVIYGRGRLAGPALRGDEIVLENSVGQMALIGESCECETDRSWLEERTVPMRWDVELARQAAQTLGFDPDNGQVQAEIKKVIARGRANSRPDTAGDQIERIVAGYFESGLASGEPELLTIPPGRSESKVQATIIRGSGWDFDPPSQTAGGPDNVAIDADLQDAVAQDNLSQSSSQLAEGTGQPSSVAKRTQLSSLSWLSLFAGAAALGIIAIVGLAFVLRK